MARQGGQNTEPEISDLEQEYAWWWEESETSSRKWRSSLPLGDAAAWDSFVQANLSQEELVYLQEAFRFSPAHQLIRDSDPQRIRDIIFRAYCERVCRMQVDIQAGGRTVIQDPSEDYRVELVWLYHRRKKAHRIKKLSIIADGFLSPEEYPDLHEYTIAFYLRNRRLDPARTYGRPPVARPLPGQPLNADFYRRLLNTYDKLVVEGHASPALELAERMDVNHSTVKSWLSRGRKYLKEGSD